MKTLLKTTSLLLFCLCFINCTPEEKPGDSSGFDVKLEIPATINLGIGATTIDFNVIDGKAPKQTDLIILDGPAGQKFCKILSSSSQSITVELYTDFQNGSHKISVQRGLDVLSLGTCVISVEAYDDGVNPDKESTVYGRVSCNGVGLANVVVSDGNEVVATDKNGVYQMTSAKKHGYVFVSIPSGYNPPRDIVFPVFYKYTDKSSSVVERIDFELTQSRDQSSFEMLVFGDLHLADRSNDDLEQFEHVIEDLQTYLNDNRHKTIYGLTLGDMTWDSYWVSNDYSFKEYKAEMKPLQGYNFFILQTCGNHDHSLEYAGDFDTMIDYKTNLGPSYYSYNIGEVHIISLDDIECKNPGGGGKASYSLGLTNEIMEWLKKDLAYVSKDRPVIVSMHAPFYSNPGSQNSIKYRFSNTTTAATLEDLLDDFKEAHIFSAHTHVMYNADNDKIFEHNAGAVCACWWWTDHLVPGIHISTDGTPGGYTIFKVDGKDISWQYKGTKQSVETQFRTYDRNEIDLSEERYILGANASNKQEFLDRITGWSGKSTANEVYINCWNYDPEWKITVTENGKELAVERFAISDPLHLFSYTAPRLRANKGLSFDTNLHHHMFKVTASSPNSTLIITATDRFGNEYTEEMKRPKEFNIGSYRMF